MTELAPTELAPSQVPETSRRKGVVQRMFEAMAAAQQARANRYVMSAMARLPDHQLADLGFTAEQIREIRSHSNMSAAWL